MAVSRQWVLELRGHIHRRYIWTLESFPNILFYSPHHCDLSTQPPNCLAINQSYHFPIHKISFPTTTSSQNGAPSIILSWTTLCLFMSASYSVFRFHALIFHCLLFEFIFLGTVPYWKTKILISPTTPVDSGAKAGPPHPLSFVPTPRLTVEPWGVALAALEGPAFVLGSFSVCDIPPIGPCTN